VVPKVSEFAWELPKLLAEYANSSCRKYATDKDLSESFLNQLPVPQNIEPTLKLDMKGGIFRNCEGQITVSHCQQTRDILTPLSKVWELVEDARRADGNHEFDVEETALRLQQSVTLVGQAINATNFHRRKTVLSSLAQGDILGGVARE